VVLKMDVEGAEWRSLLRAPASLLRRIDQLAVEFHGIDDPLFRDVILRLKEHFYVVNVHYNNYRCQRAGPFPADTYEVLFVNKRIGVLDTQGKAQFPHPLDRPNDPMRPDCQVPDLAIARGGRRGPRA
jgi:hypothetical protein